MSMSGRSEAAISPVSKHGDSYSERDEVYKPTQRLKRAMSLRMSTQTADDTWGATSHYLFRSQSRQSLMSDAQVWLTNMLCLLYGLPNFFCSDIVRDHASLIISTNWIINLY